jgi:hypothetical protein
VTCHPLLAAATIKGNESHLTVRSLSFLGGSGMRSRLFVCVLLSCASGAGFAKEPKAYQTGKLLQMVSVQCGTAEKDAMSVPGEMLGSDTGTKKTQQLLCQEYVLETQDVLYHIRPRNEKHAVLLPIGGQAQFRLQKDRMLLRVQDIDDKEREYVVISITPRTDSSTADSRPVHLNHLQ